MKIKTIIFIIILYLIFSGKIEQAYMKFVDINMCADIGMCAEGMTVGIATENPILINKENCLKNNWKWNDETRYCNMRSKN